MLTKTFQDITHPDDLAEDLGHVQRMLDGQIETYQMEKRYFHKDGRIVYVLLSVSLVWTDDKKPNFFISQIQDITQRKQLEEELVRFATEDALTGVFNRRRFFEYTEREIVRGGRFCEPMALLMLDIDNFKLINDTYGHDVGDEILKLMASTCKSTLRVVDVFGRIGGEEFAALLVNTDAHVGKIIAERVRSKIESLSYEAAPGTIHFTVSIGLVAFFGSKHALDYRLKQADVALYKAKRAGRNCIQHHIDVEEFDDSFERMQAGFIHLSWKQAYECGNEKIDSQHKHLFEISNTLLIALISEEPKDICNQIIEDLVSNIVHHFREEDEIFRAAGFPLADEHSKIHNELVLALGRLVQKFQCDELNPPELFGFLALEVISKHMLHEDRKFFPYLTAR